MDFGNAGSFNQKIKVNLLPAPDLSQPEATTPAQRKQLKYQILFLN